MKCLPEGGESKERKGGKDWDAVGPWAALQLPAHHFAIPTTSGVTRKKNMSRMWPTRNLMSGFSTTASLSQPHQPLPTGMGSAQSGSPDCALDADLQMSAYEMEIDLDEIAKLISSTREEVKYQEVITRQHLKNCEAVYVVHL